MTVPIDKQREQVIQITTFCQPELR